MPGSASSELWVIDAVGLRTRIHREPTAEGYRNVLEFLRLSRWCRFWSRRSPSRSLSWISIERHHVVARTVRLGRSRHARRAMKIAILGGAGLMGSGIVHDLLSDRSIVPIEAIRIADVSEPQRALIGTWPTRASKRSSSTSPTAPARGGGRGVDICINAVPTMLGYQMEIFEAASRPRGLSRSRGAWHLHGAPEAGRCTRFRDAGVCAVIGAGADPGMSNVLCRRVADELDTIERLNLYWAAELVGPENPILVPPYSVSTVLAEYALPSTQFLDGRHVEDAADDRGRGDRPARALEPVRVHVLAPFRAAHGAGREGHRREGDPRVHLEASPAAPRARCLGRPREGRASAATTRSTIGGVTVRPMQVLSGVISRNIERNRRGVPAQASHEIHFVIGPAPAAAPATAWGEIIVRPNAMYEGYVDAATSMNGSIAAQLMLVGARPGVWAPEEIFDVRLISRELRKRKFDVSLNVV